MRKYFCFLSLTAIVFSGAGWLWSAPAPAGLAAVAAAEQKALNEARVAAAKEVYETTLKQRELGIVRETDAELLYRWSCRWLEAERQLAQDEGGRQLAVEGHFKRMRQLLKFTRGLRETGAAGSRDVAAARFYAVEAQQWYVEATKTK